MRLSLAVAAMIALPAAALSQMAPHAQGQKEMQQSGAADRLGGYQPAQPALSGPVPPGSRVVYQQAPSPAEAYPAPPPMEHYPFCKRGQFDHCLQRGG